MKAAEALMTFKPERSPGLPFTNNKSVENKPDRVLSLMDVVTEISMKPIDQDSPIIRCNLHPVRGSRCFPTKRQFITTENRR